MPQSTIKPKGLIRSCDFYQCRTEGLLHPPVNDNGDGKGTDSAAHGGTNFTRMVMGASPLKKACAKTSRAAGNDDACAKESAQ